MIADKCNQDLLARLRDHVGTAHINETDAADEIERLRAIVAKLTVAAKNTLGWRGYGVEVLFTELHAAVKAAEAKGGDDA